MKLTFRRFMIAWIPIVIILNMFVWGLSHNHEPYLSPNYPGIYGNADTNIIVYNVVMALFILLIYWSFKEAEKEKLEKSKTRKTN